jgi:hypothetical protein
LHESRLRGPVRPPEVIHLKAQKLRRALADHLPLPFLLRMARERVTWFLRFSGPTRPFWFLNPARAAATCSFSGGSRGASRKVDRKLASGLSFRLTHETKGVGTRLDLLGEIAAVKCTSPKHVWLSLGFSQEQLQAIASGDRSFSDVESQAIQKQWAEHFPGGVNDMTRQIGRVPLVTAQNLDQVFMPERRGIMRAGDRINSPFSKMELERLDLLLEELGSWARRTVLVKPQAIAELEPAVRRLINEVEQGRLNTLKREAIAEPETLGEVIRSLVMALPTQGRRQLLDWLADQNSDQKD